MLKWIAVTALTCLAATPACAQRIALPCPLSDAPQPAGPPQNGALPPRPFFDFNGIYKTGDTPIPGFACDMVGPFAIGGHDWYVQRVQGLIPGKDPNSKLRTNAVRMCTKRLRVRLPDGTPLPLEPVTGPFGGPLGPSDCELVQRTP